MLYRRVKHNLQPLAQSALMEDHERTIGQRIVLRRGEVGMPQAELAKKCGVSRQAVHQWENDITEPTGINIVECAFARNTSELWLAKGLGSRVRNPPLSEEERRLVAQFRAMNPRDRQTIVDLANRFAPAPLPFTGTM